MILMKFFALTDAAMCQAFLLCPLRMPLALLKYFIAEFEVFSEKTQHTLKVADANEHFISVGMR